MIKCTQDYFYHDYKGAILVSVQIYSDFSIPVTPLLSSSFNHWIYLAVKYLELKTLVPSILS